MPQPGSAAQYRALFNYADDKAAVIALPAGFDLAKRLRDAKAIRLATAFAHMNGWQLLAAPVLSSKAEVRLLTGLFFLQTEPRLLREWNRLATSLETRGRIMARLANRSTMFHPKVLIVESTLPEQAFAIIGSGNLSVGGFRTNVECGLYTADAEVISSVIQWFDDQWTTGIPLTEADIKTYRKQYDKTRKTTANIQKAGKSVEEVISERAKAVFRQRKKAVAEAQRFFRTAEYQRGYEKRKNAAGRIRAALDIPRFEFGKTGWLEFFGIPELGRLRLVYRDAIYRKAPQLKEALRTLLDNRLPAGSRLSSLLEKEGAHHIRGLGLNVVSKILAVWNIDKWPVYNGPVESTLRYFGYEPPRAAGVTGRYLEFVAVMDSFKTDCGAPDVLALDAFFWHWHDRVKNQKK